ncbi:hypothetical protein ACG7TL_006134 [Trametes sanguinea]
MHRGVRTAVLAQDGEASMSTELEGRGRVLRVLESEMRAQRVVIDDAEMVSLSAIGVADYCNGEEPRLHGNRPHQAHEGTLRSTKQQARAEYIHTTSIMAEVLHALKGHEPTVLLRDIRNVPTLVSQNLQSVSHLEELNQEALERIDQTVDRIEYMQGNTHSGTTLADEL